jgi:hypothetical protein
MAESPKTKLVFFVLVQTADGGMNMRPDDWTFATVDGSFSAERWSTSSLVTAKRKATKIRNASAGYSRTHIVVEEAAA